MVWPKGWVCHAVRAPGVKWTLAAAARAGGSGLATVSTNTAPVNQSLGPGVVSSELRVICMSLLLAGGGHGAHAAGERRALGWTPAARSGTDGVLEALELLGSWA